MKYLTIKQVAAKANRDQSVINRGIKAGRFNAIRPGHEWLIADDRKLQDYIQNPPKPGRKVDH